MTGTYRRQLAELLVGIGWWPAHITFDLDDLATVGDVFKERERDRRRR